MDPYTASLPLPSHFFPSDALPGAFDHPHPNFLLGSSSYPGHEATALSSSDATGFTTDSHSGYPYPSPSQPLLAHRAPPHPAPSFNFIPHPLKNQWSGLPSTLHQPTSSQAAFFKTVPPGGGMTILPTYSSSSRRTRSAITAPEHVAPGPSARGPANDRFLVEPVKLEGSYPPPAAMGSYPPPEIPPTFDGQTTGPGDKKHKCWMCHKSFDSVASNLSRHVKRCSQKQQRGAGSSISADSPPSSDRSSPACSTSTDGPSAIEARTRSPTLTVTSPSGLSDVSAELTDATTSTSTLSCGATSTATSGRSSRKRRLADVTTSDPAPSDAPPAAEASTTSRGTLVSSAEPSTSTSTFSTTRQPRAKRRRRAPSPSNWIPESLRHFDLTPLPKATPVPLPPVEPYGAAGATPDSWQWEERDSFDRSMAMRPYHPEGWKGVLPGPGVAMMGAGWFWIGSYAWLWLSLYLSVPLES
ncbi:hypothetical protein EIP91_010385 [Steccherinum ochraceum]|uniref:C2H2-type domain-containing protein n=1 Tax=Steccherinum ochraceum TaxID=92696 RepID=A0A4R0RQV2_9APHY|nr:hypothetical protein EIP91_010385 [Steccherinum ochraceum]